MHLPIPNEALASRLLIAWERGELQRWATRLFAPGVAIHADDGHDVELLGPEAVVSGVFDPLRDELDGPSLVAAVALDVDRDGATLSFERGGARRELYLHVGGGRIDQVWSRKAIPSATRGEGAWSDGGSCGPRCCGG
ncbi:MAG: hypothetical protein JSS99_11395 [Actinobacteria bacterium]|nr:hypothetical protein [Actinomycetota bacterium]